MPGPLHGIRMIDLCTALSGPIALGILADQGAEVIKVEAPGPGDINRAVGSRRNGQTSLYHLTNRGKRAITLDLTKPRSHEVFARLVGTADVVAQNFRPGVADRIGIGYEAVRSIHPDVIYLSIAGFGFRGPMAQQKVFDNLIQGASGIASVQGVDSDPVYIRQLAADKITAATAAQAITAALLARERGAGGQHIELAMLDASIAWMWYDAGTVHALLEPDAEHYKPGRSWEIVRNADGYTTSAPVTNDEFRGWSISMGVPEFADDPRFATHHDRMTHPDFPAARREIMQRGRDITVVEMLQRFRDNGVSGTEVATLERLPHVDQIVANGTFVESDHPQLGRVREVRPPARFSATPAAAGGPAPREGEHTDEVLRELGYDGADIAALRELGTVS